MKDLYLVAKYVPDLTRREPRNVGVILHQAGQWAARFVGEDASQPLDRRRLRQFNSVETYAEWHRFWRDALEKGAFSTAAHRWVEPSDVAFVDALRAASRDHFVLEYGQPLAIPCELGTPEAAVAYLFDCLVGREEAVAEEATIGQRMQDVAARFGLEGSRHWRSNYTLRVAKDCVVFPYAYLNGEHRYYKTMAIPARRLDSPELLKNAHDIFWSFQQARTKDKGCARIALINPSSEQRTSSIASDVRDLLLDQVDSIVDLSEDRQVLGEFGRLRP